MSLKQGRAQKQDDILRVAEFQLQYLLRLTVGLTTMINKTPQVAFIASINNLQNRSPFYS